MKMTIAVAVFGQLEDTKAFWGCLSANTTHKEEIELLVVDNHSPDDTVAFLNRFILPLWPNARIIQNNDNLGVVPTLQQIYQESKGDIIAILHNDLFIFEYAWNERVASVFAQDEKVGMAGFFGAKAAAANGGRGGCYSNFLEAEIHGQRTSGAEEVVLFDGVALICRRAMLDQVGGFDQNLNYLYYDKDISLESFTHGWRNILVGIACHHRSGVTANRPDYQNWIAKKLNAPVEEAGMIAYRQAEEYYLKKWEGRLPLSVG